MKDFYQTNKQNKQRLIILEENKNSVPGNINEVQIKNIYINVKRNPIVFKYSFYNKVQGASGYTYDNLLNDELKIDDFDANWLVKDFDYFKFTRDSIHSIYVNIIYKNNFKSNYVKNIETDFYFTYVLNDKLMLNYIKALNLTHNTSNAEGYLKVTIISANGDFNCVSYKDDKTVTNYLYNIRPVKDSNSYDIEPIEHKSTITGDFSINVENANGEMVKYNYIYIYENNIKYLIN